MDVCDQCWAGIQRSKVRAAAEPGGRAGDAAAAVLAARPLWGSPHRPAHRLLPLWGGGAIHCHFQLVRRVNCLAGWSGAVDWGPPPRCLRLPPDCPALRPPLPPQAGLRPLRPPAAALAQPPPRLLLRRLRLPVSTGAPQITSKSYEIFDF